jgi:tRNA(Ile)-lysidine synthase
MLEASRPAGRTALERLTDALDRFFSDRAPVAPGERLIVAFSGGPDSTALLHGLRELAKHREIGLHAAHLDHAGDARSADRAARAAEIATQIGVPVTLERLAADGTRSPRGPEEAARRARYAFLERIRSRVGARYVVTAHHRDDQVESVLLRILHGSGLPGLGGIAPLRGAVVRPLLDFGRRELALALEPSTAIGPAPVADPTNQDLDRPRNLLRHHLLPQLVSHDPGLPERVVALGSAATAARRRIEGELRRRWADARTGALEPSLAALGELPPALWPYLLGMLHREAGAPYPPGQAATRELRREVRRALATGSRVGCDAGGGWRWESTDRGLRVVFVPLSRTASLPTGFAYTLQAPGWVALPEIGRKLRLSRQEPAPWMLRGSATRAALALELDPERRITVRSRRPGDRIRPLGCTYRRRLKELLIDHRIPREERSRLPLLCVDGRIVWVPGVTVDEACRIRGNGPVWVAELLEE